MLTILTLNRGAIKVPIRRQVAAPVIAQAHRQVSPQVQYAIMGPIEEQIWDWDKVHHLFKNILLESVGESL